MTCSTCIHFTRDDARQQRGWCHSLRDDTIAGRLGNGRRYTHATKAAERCSGYEGKEMVRQREFFT